MYGCAPYRVYVEQKKDIPIKREDWKVERGEKDAQKGNNYNPNSN